MDISQIDFVKIGTCMFLFGVGSWILLRDWEDKRLK